MTRIAAACLLCYLAAGQRVEGALMGDVKNLTLKGFKATSTRSFVARLTPNTAYRMI